MDDKTNKMFPKEIKMIDIILEKEELEHIVRTLRKKIVYGFYEGDKPSYRQGTEKDDCHEMEEEVTAEDCNSLVEYIEKSRAKVVEIAKMFSGNEGVDYETTKTDDLLLLIQDSVEDVLIKLKEHRDKLQMGTNDKL